MYNICKSKQTIQQRICKMIKLLITTGCSFTQYPGSNVSWSYHLSKSMNVETLFLGHGAASNGIISKKTIFNTLDALKKYKPEEILVGIMWSGAHRSEMYTELFLDTEKREAGFNDKNPLAIVEDENYYLLNPHWSDEQSVLYYKYFHNDIGSTIKTIEHILNTQWFLKSQGVNYFMTEYYVDVFNKDKLVPHKHPNNFISILEHPDVKYYYDLIDFNNWLPVEDCQTWVKNKSGYDFPRKNDPHPGTLQHKEYTEKVIIPFLKGKNIWQQNEIK